jgi:hypothetical protein
MRARFALNGRNPDKPGLLTHVRRITKRYAPPFWAPLPQAEKPAIRRPRIAPAAPDRLMDACKRHEGEPMRIYPAQARVGAAFVLVATLTAPAFAAPPPAVPGRARAVQALADCRKITDNTARLACYDGAAATFDQAEAKGDIVVVDREQARSMRRQAFGFTLPSLSLFERGEKPEEIEAAVGTVASARQGPTGKWVIHLQDGATWAQIDTNQVTIDPKPGMPVKIRKASLGSYLMTVGHNGAFRAHREE